MLSLNWSTVCMVVYNKYPADPRVRRAAESLVAAGYKVHVICTSEQGAPLEDEFNGVTIHRIPVLKDSGVEIANFIAVAAFMFRAAGKVLSVHRRFRPAYYHVHSLPDFLVAVVLIPRMLGARLVLDLHESFPEIVRARFKTGAGLFALIARWIERLSCVVSNRVIVVNDMIAGLVIKRGERPDRVTVIMNSPRIYDRMVSSGRVHPEVAAATASGDPLFVYAGGLNRERDLITLLDAVDILQKKNLRLRVLIFSHTETPFLKTLKEHVGLLGLKNLVRFCGSLSPEHVVVNVRAGNLGIVTYERNPLTEVALPNKVFEYIEAGLPLVVADLCALRGLLGSSADYYLPGDPLSLAETIQSVLNEDGRDKATSAYKKYQQCSWDVMEKRLLTLYEGLGAERTESAHRRHIA